VGGAVTAAVGVRETATVVVAVPLAGTVGSSTVGVRVVVIAIVAVDVGEGIAERVRVAVGVWLRVGAVAAADGPPAQKPAPTAYAAPLAVPASGCPIVEPRLNVPPVVALDPPASMVLRRTRYGPADCATATESGGAGASSESAARRIGGYPGPRAPAPTSITIVRREDRANIVHPPSPWLDAIGARSGASRGAG
jgi:hypothetical protein